MFVNIKAILLTSVIYFLMHTHAYAYLDPGTGSTILQAIAAALAVGVATISHYWNKVKDLYLDLQWGNPKPGSIYIDNIEVTEAFDFTPDVDVRTYKSIVGKKSILYEYYDNTLQKDEYIEASAPVEVRFYFYRRTGNTQTIFDSKFHPFLYFLNLKQSILRSFFYYYLFSK